MDIKRTFIERKLKGYEALLSTLIHSKDSDKSSRIKAQIQAVRKIISQYNSDLQKLKEGID